MLETAFQGVNAVIGSISNLFKGDDEPPAAEYIAEGARDVRINSQPAARSGARCTCEARVVNEPGNGAFVSPDEGHGRKQRGAVQPADVLPWCALPLRRIWPDGGKGGPERHAELPL
ncbi:Uncharacterised protein [Escherichia coli]|nr:Uncharacterised protein [Escherichia coli]